MLISKEVLHHRSWCLLSSHVISCIKTLVHVHLALHQLILLCTLSRLGLLLDGQYLVKATGAQTELLVAIDDTRNAFIHIIFTAELYCLGFYTFNESIILSFFLHSLTQLLGNVQASLVLACSWAFVWRHLKVIIARRSLVQTDLAATLHHGWIEWRAMLDIRHGVSRCRVTHLLFMDGFW